MRVQGCAHRSAMCTLLTAFATLSVAAISASAKAQCTLALPRQYPIFGGADAMIVADLDANGRIDVLPLVPNAPRFEIQPNGTLLQVGTISVISSSRGGAAADFNNDGMIDLVFGGYASTGSVNIALATSPGVFAAPLSASAGSWPTTVIAADVTGDNLPDVIVRNDSGIILLRNLGDGVLAAAQNILNGSHIGLVGADLDQDGDVDIATISFGGNSFIRILVNDGTGSFAFHPDISTATSARDLATPDLNHDGRLDLVTVARDNLLAAVHLASGPTLSFTQSNISIPGNPKSMALLDANQDGNTDVVFSTEDNNGGLVLLMNNGAGQLSAGPLAGTSPNIRGIAAAVPEPGEKPLILATGILGLSVHPLNEIGNLTGSAYVNSGARTSAGDIADMNGDGLADIVGLSRTQVSILFQQANGAYASPVSYALPNGGSYGLVFTRDLNDDAHPDVIVFSDETTTARVALNNGDGTLSPFASFPGVTGVRSIREIDLNNDGRLDFFVSGGVFGECRRLLNLGDGALTELPGPNFESFSAPCMSDANRDGLLDIVFSRSGDDPTNNIGVRLALANGIFEPARFTTVPDRASDMIAADFDNDGVDEYAVRTEHAIYLLESDGNGTLSNTSSYPLQTDGYRIDAADLDNDGALDLIAFNPTVLIGGSGIDLLRNRGDGFFESPVTLVSAYDARSFSIGDVDADQHKDLMIASYISSTTTSFAILHGPFFPCRADFNCDQIVDFFDYADFVQAFSAGTLNADFNGDDVIDLFDYLDFVATFARNC